MDLGQDPSSEEEDEYGIRNRMVRDRATSSRSLKVSLGEVHAFEKEANVNLAPSDEEQEDDKDSDDEAEPPVEEPREFTMNFQDVEANTLGNLPL